MNKRLASHPVNNRMNQKTKSSWLGVGVAAVASPNGEPVLFIEGGTEVIVVSNVDAFLAKVDKAVKRFQTREASSQYKIVCPDGSTVAHDSGEVWLFDSIDAAKEYALGLHETTGRSYKVVPS
jgi:hypothetical protein